MSRNIIVVLSDDHAQWAAGCYGNSEVQTPNLDHLARTGVRFRNAFTPSPVCSPSRASFFTGRLPSQHGVHDYLATADPEVAAVPWLQGERFLGELLQEQGYQTGLSGKWHLGDDETRARGFDYWYSRSAPIPQVEGYDSPWPISAVDEVSYDRHAITDHAIEFLRHRDQDRPFFLFVGYVATHSPWDRAPQRLVDRYRSATFRDIPADSTYPFGRLRSESVYPSRANPREALAQYYAAVTDIDDQVGRMLDTLDTLGLREDTTVVYTSDHGLNMGHHGIWGKGNGTLPYNVVDESIRIPLIVNAPSASISGQVRDEMVTHLDTFQTILDLAGIELDAPADRYPGISYAPALLSVPPTGADRVFAEYGTLRMVRTRNRKLVRRFPAGPDELIDLDRDPRETVNVIADPAYAGDLAELDDALTTYFLRFEDPRRRGVDAAAQPRHNGDEAWRDDGSVQLIERPDWIDRIEAEIRSRRTAHPGGSHP